MGKRFARTSDNNLSDSNSPLGGGGLPSGGQAPTAAGPKVRNGLLAVILKEFKRFFTDYRMVLTTILLPGIMIYAIYSLMGTALTSMTTTDAAYQPTNYVVNLPESLAPACDQAQMDFRLADASQVEAIKSEVAEKRTDMLVVFPADFDRQVQAGLGGRPPTEAAAAGDPATAAAGDSATAASQTVPEVVVYYNSTRTESSLQYSKMTGLLDAYKNSIAPLFVVNAGAGAEEGFDLASGEDISGQIFSTLLPLLILIFLYSGCAAVAPESIAGEKERGTIATLLVTPLARWKLALGKIIALSCIALLSSLSSFLGVVLSLPKLVGATGGVSAAIYGAADYLLLLVVIFSTVLVLVGLISLLSAIARTVKEAATYVMPLMVLVMIVGALGMFSQGATENISLYLVPLYNSVQSMIGILSFTLEPTHIAITVAVNLAIAAICVITLARMIASERIVFCR